MADLRIANPSTTEEFNGLLRDLMAPPPWNFTEGGTVIDAAGDVVLQVDPNGERPDPQVADLAVWIVMAVNTCAGFKAAEEAQANG